MPPARRRVRSPFGEGAVTPWHATDQPAGSELFAGTTRHFVGRQDLRTPTRVGRGRVRAGAPPPLSRLAYTAPSWVLRPFPAWTAVLYPFGELRVHHEVVDVLLCFGELQLPGHHGHHEGSAASTLWADSKRAGGERTSSRGQVWGSPAVGAHALWLVRGTEPVGTLIPAPTRGSVALLARLQS